MFYTKGQLGAWGSAHLLGDLTRLEEGLGGIPKDPKPEVPEVRL